MGPEKPLSASSRNALSSRIGAHLKGKPSAKTFDKLCVWSGPISAFFFFLLFLTADLLPPIAPYRTAEEVVAHYRSHEAGFKAGAGLMQFTGMFYCAFVAATSGQMARIPGCTHTMIACQSISGTISAYSITLPSLFFCITVFRLDRPLELTLLLNDMTWMITAIPFVTFIGSNFAFSWAILSDTREVPLFPRWVAYASSIWPLGFLGALGIHCSKRGAFAWHGAMAFWVPAASFGFSLLLNTYYLLKAIDKHDEPNAHLQHEVGH
ncbi:hypothetical protein PFICI_02359 [Pestalotiopsis fici W106-1]|uniref:Uncharacterized protein n=1 Tax=Pestalotiopsis fici (strain W106-1 / CGMCC3.15140) TaxID=1229662 RepID=W3XE95_PESFW|nr:uncharacterized protein PFICI_02359 [Pestalotiopsis fici W106-1]ETS84334.1 hypothetical protein PFICI_02359 [Pestalotiopsis fici W106-1]